MALGRYGDLALEDTAQAERSLKRCLQSPVGTAMMPVSVRARAAASPELCSVQVCTVYTKVDTAGRGVGAYNTRCSPAGVWGSEEPTALEVHGAADACLALCAERSRYLDLARSRRPETQLEQLTLFRQH